MMKLIVKKSFLVSVLLLSTSSLSFALPISLTDVVTMWDKDGHYSLQKEDDTYHSFCLESSKYFSSGTQYSIESIGDVAFGGGTKRVKNDDGKWITNDVGEYVYKAVGANGDRVNKASKWLFASYFTDKKDVTNQQVQEAIWWKEGERKGKKESWQYLRDLYSWETTKLNYVGWDIVAVNIISYDDNNQVVDRQSQLIGAAPVPEPTTMLLFGAGLIGLVGTKLRRKK